MTAVAAAEVAPPRASTSSLANASTLVMIGFIATTLAQPQALGGIPLRNMMKNEMHLPRAAASAFIFWIGLAWYFKPLAGIITDAFPILGSRRRAYMIGSSVAAAAVWGAVCFTPHKYMSLLYIFMFLSLFMVFASTAVGGFMVEAGQAQGASGRLSSVREIAQRTCTIIVGPTAGFLASIAFHWTAIISALIIFALAPLSFLLMRETPVRPDPGRVFAKTWRQLKNIGRARTLWAAAGLTLLVFIAPGFGTALFYRQQTELHMTPQAQGFLSLIEGVCGFGGAFLYAGFARRLTLRWLLSGALAFSAIITLGFLFYHSVLVAQAMAGIGGFGGAFAEIALFDLAVRSTPAGSEALGFSLMISVRNLAVFATDWLGSWMLDQHIASFDNLVWINAATTAVCVPLVFLLPRALIRRRDAEIPADVPAPPAQIQLD